MPATSRATVVLPVPGLPSKIRCRVIVGDLRPASLRSPSTRSTAACRWISALTSPSPTSASSSARSSSTVFAGGSGSFGCSGSAGCSGGGRGRLRWLIRNSLSWASGPFEMCVVPHALDPLADHAELIHHLGQELRVGPGTGSRGVPSARLGLVVPGPRSWAAAAVAALPTARGLSSPSEQAAIADVRQRLGVRRSVHRAVQCQRRHRRGRCGAVAPAPGRRVHELLRPTRRGRSRGTSRRRHPATARRWSRPVPPPRPAAACSSRPASLAAAMSASSAAASVDRRRELIGGLTAGLTAGRS